jgi:hypothetical protein
MQRIRPMARTEDERISSLLFILENYRLSF